MNVSTGDGRSQDPGFKPHLGTAVGVKRQVFHPGKDPRTDQNSKMLPSMYRSFQYGHIGQLKKFGYLPV